MAPTPIETSEEIAHTASLWAVKERPLSEADDAALREWLAGDRRRRGALLRAQATWASLARAKALGPAAQWAENGHSQSANLNGKLSRRRFWVASAAVGGTAAAGLTGLIISQPGNETVTRTGEIRRLPMSDGSIAAINTESRLRIDMTQSQRKVELVEGEAWFKVAKNKERPFVVTAGTARAQAVGTAFSVKRRGGGAEILVTEGTVRVWTVGADQQAVLLNAGDRTFIGQMSNGQTPAIDVQYAPDAINSDLAWREGQIALNGKSLAEVAVEYNRYNRIKIVIQDPVLGNERLLGRLSADDPEAFSNAIAQAFDAEIIRTDTAIYIGVKKTDVHHTERSGPGIVN